MDTQTTLSPFLDETQLRQYELKPNTQQLLLQARESGKIATAEISAMFPASLIRNREKFPKAMVWLTKTLQAINVKIYVGRPEDLGWEGRALPTGRVWKRVERKESQGQEEEISIPSMYPPISEEELKKIEMVDREFTDFYDSERIAPFYREIKNYPLLSHEQVLELGERIAKHDDLEARDKLILHNIRLSLYLARKHIGRGVDYDDLVQEGCVGLMTAVERFEYQRGFHFSTYAYWWVRQVIRRAIDNQAHTVRIPVHALEFRYKVMKVVEELAQELHRAPMVEEIAARMGAEVDKVQKALDQLQLKAVSLNNLISLGDDSEEERQNITADEAAMDPYTALEAKEKLAESCKKINQLLTLLRCAPSLSLRNREAFTKFYGLDGTWERRTLEKTAEGYGLTGGRVRQIIVKIWKLLNVCDPSLDLDHEKLEEEFERIARLENIVGEQAVFKVGELSQAQRDTMTERLFLSGASGQISSSSPKVNVAANPVRTPEMLALTELEEKIPFAVCNAYGISMGDLIGDSRRPKIAWARQVAVYLLRTDAEMSYPEIAAKLKYKDHTTAIYAYSKVKYIIEHDPRRKADIDGIRAVCKGTSPTPTKGVEVGIEQTAKDLVAEMVLELVSKTFSTSSESILRKDRRDTRNDAVCIPRRIVVHLLREDFDWSFNQIATSLGRSDGSVVWNIYKGVPSEIQNNKELQAKVEEIRAKYHLGIYPDVEKIVENQRKLFPGQLTVAEEMLAVSVEKSKALLEKLKAIDSPERSKQAFRMYYGLGDYSSDQTLETVGKSIGGVTRERVRQIIGPVWEKLSTFNLELGNGESLLLELSRTRALEKLISSSK